VNKADHIIVVIDEAKSRLIHQHNIAEEKITVVRNVVDVDAFLNHDLDPEIIHRYSNYFTVVYVGGGGSHRGLDTVIQSLNLVQEYDIEIKLLLVGPGGKEAEKLMGLARAVGVEDLIEITGWQPMDKVPSYIHASDVCIVPHKKNPHTDNTIPHKLFQYMLLEKPIIVSNCDPLKRIVENVGCGLVFTSEDSQDIAEKLKAIYEDSKLRVEMGAKGREAVIKRYNWREESKSLASLYENLG
jgi:glycosyltransferase involved in cell wall biosynthesis